MIEEQEKQEQQRIEARDEAQQASAAEQTESLVDPDSQMANSDQAVD